MTFDILKKHERVEKLRQEVNTVNQNMTIF